MKDIIRDILRKTTGVDSNAFETNTPSIPGTIDVPGREFVYIGNVEKDNIRNAFFNLMDEVLRGADISGGALVAGCEIIVPDGRKFQAISYKGDLGAWRKRVQLGADSLGFTLAKVEKGCIVLDTGERYELSASNILFY